ncbi:MAG: glycosyltransferase family 2 protein [Flavobacterium sp.]|jgi:GT2 family glycosyltransferase
MNIELSIIIVNYNGLKYLDDCINSLYNNLKGINYEIIIIDNNSQDQSCNFIKNNFPEVVLIESKINYGFGKGNNEAIKISRGEYLLLINNDTILLNNIIEIIELLKSDLSIGVIGINMLNGNKDYLPAAGNFPNFSNMFIMKKMFDLGSEFKKGKFSKETYEVDWLGGSFLLMKKEIYLKINGFDEDYFMYVEDVDLCKKIKNIGLKRLFYPKLNYIHFVGFKKSNNPMLIKGYNIYIRKHFKGLQKTSLLLVLMINFLVKKIKSNLNIF